MKEMTNAETIAMARELRPDLTVEQITQFLEEIDNPTVLAIESFCVQKVATRTGRVKFKVTWKELLQTPSFVSKEWTTNGASITSHRHCTKFFRNKAGIESFRASLESKVK